eukprot:9591276-Lingulodinium_polyedra.AAC.1
MEGAQPASPSGGGAEAQSYGIVAVPPMAVEPTSDNTVMVWPFPVALGAQEVVAIIARYGDLVAINTSETSVLLDPGYWAMSVQFRPASLARACID